MAVADSSLTHSGSGVPRHHLHLLTEDKKSFEEKVLSFSTEEVLLISPKNAEKKKHIEKDVTTALGKVVGDVEGCSWLKN